MAKCFIVIGCPRTGTSLTMGILTRLGVYGGDDYRNGPNNPCYFEDRTLYEFVNVNGSASADDVVAKLHREPTWGFKHPRVVWLWDRQGLEDVIESPHFVLTHRRNFNVQAKSHRRCIRRQTREEIEERANKYYAQAEILRGRHPMIDVYFEDYFDEGPREAQLALIAEFCGGHVTDHVRELINPKYRSDLRQRKRK